MTRELKGWCKPRPIRIAFLIQDSEHGQLMLDAIFADCYSRWGGRFSLIVPCIDARISPSYWRWLESYDPDVVYSYVLLSKEDVLEIHERLSPADYVYHQRDNTSRLDASCFRPSYEFKPMSSLSTVFRAARYNSKRAPLNIIDSWHTEASTRFLTDNFGTYRHSYGTSMFPPDARSAASLLTIVSPEKCRDRKYGVPQDLNMVESESAALGQFANGGATSLSMLSALFVSRIDIRDQRWGGSFNLVVGDSYADRLIFWNARLSVPAWLDGSLSCLRVSFWQLKDPDFLVRISDLINHHNHISADSGGQTLLTVRSASLTEEELSEGLSLVQAAKLWSVVRAESSFQLDDLVPPANAFDVARDRGLFVDSELKPPEWTAFLWVNPIARPPDVGPEHLSDAPMRQAFIQGSWATDFSFEHDGVAPSGRKTNQWILPRRWRTAGAFRFTFNDSQPLPNPKPTSLRRSQYGSVGVFVSAARPVESVRVPTIFQALEFALAADPRYFWNDSKSGRFWPANCVRWLRESNEARYLTGVLGMAGGLLEAGHFLLHPFLQNMFARLGGAPNLANTDVSATVDSLVKQAKKEKSFDLSSPEDRIALAGLIVKAARSIKTPMNFISYGELKTQWTAYQDRYWETHVVETHDPDDEVDWRRQGDASLDSCLVDLRNGQLLFQGYQWTCKNCHHKNWVDLVDLALDLPCEVCKQTTPMPVNLSWQFRPNEFLIECLHSHSVLSLVWTLAALRHRARRSFAYLGPTCFGFSFEDKKPDAEADLLVLIDGEATLCEVKSSWRSLRPSHVDDFVALAVRLRPDNAILAVMEEESHQATKLGEATQLLAAQGIKFELLTPANFKVDDAPFL